MVTINLREIQKFKNSEVVFDLLKETELFYPSIFSAIYISLTIPTTIFPAKRSFRTMRRVKYGCAQPWPTWDLILYACIMYIKTIQMLISDNFYGEIVDRFVRDSRRLQFHFKK